MEEKYSHGFRLIYKSDELLEKIYQTFSESMHNQNGCRKQIQRNLSCEMTWAIKPEE